ncbi:MAG: hypothetical protein KF857_00045 [Fimbriimonadaceae bacterium]|nr:hypothetical protein [Fimbriimonadaceae bacterium]
MERRTVRNILVVLVLVFAAWLAWKAVIGIAFGLLGAAFKVVLPVLVVAGVSFWVYKKLFGERSLSDPGHPRLPRR